MSQVKEDQIKVLIVDDSAFMRKILTDILNSDPDINVIGFARNGREAIDKVKLLKPDLVTMDVEMPIMSGIEALGAIMLNNPLPVLMLSSLTSNGADETLKALELGAVDFIQKPSSIYAINPTDIKTELISKIKIAAAAKVEKKINIDIPVQSSINISTVVKSVNRSQMSKKAIIAIGISTGGPRALQSVIPLLPENITAPVLIVQHMPPGFTKSLAERLNSISKVIVKEAEDGERLKDGWVYIAPGDFHLEVVTNSLNELSIKLSKESAVSGHRPSADVMYRSIAALSNTEIIAVIMTGMGSDGANGLMELKSRAKTFIIAQDEESCVVYGMPKSAVKLGVVDVVSPLNRITNTIINRLEVL